MARAPSQAEADDIRFFSDSPPRTAWICATLLLCAIRLEASDVPESCPSNGAGHISSSASSTRPPTSGTEAKKEESSKYDVDRIGQRSVGKGANLYSLEKERSIGQAMAAAIDLHTKLSTILISMTT